MENNVDTCPKCGKALHSDPGFVIWCEHCEWNIEPEVDRSGRVKNPMERYFIKHGKKHHEKTRDLAQSLWNKRGKPVFPPSIGMAFSLVLSFAVLVFSLSALAAGVMLIIQYDFFFIAVLISFFLIAVALFPLIAFIPRRKKEHEYFDIDLSQYPASREFLDLLCEKMSIPKIEKLTLSRDYNARIVGGFFGFGSPELELGFSLWSVLKTDEKIALISHELSHIAHGDLKRNRLTSFSIETLRLWYSLLNPEWQALNNFSMMSLLMLPFEVLGWLTSRIVYALGYLQAAALFTRFQIREFYADARAAQMAGTSAVIRLLDKLHLHNEFWFTAGKYTLQPEPKPAMFDYIHSYLSSIPEGARKRLRIVMKRHMSRVEATHPPTIDRIDFIDGLSDANDLPEIPIIYMQRMEAELDALKPDLSESIEGYVRRMN
jgi:heat shock protein HtpX